MTTLSSGPLFSAAAHASPQASPGEAATLAARLQAVEIVLTETLAALIGSRPQAQMLAQRIAERTRRHMARLPMEDAAFALDTDRQATRLLRNIALILSTDALATKRSGWQPR